VLHAAGGEIATAALMDQRRLPEGHAILPEPGAVRPAGAEEPEPEPEPESIIFDKADRVAEREELRAERDRLSAELEEQRERLPTILDEARAEVERTIAAAERRLAEIDASLGVEEEPAE